MNRVSYLRRVQVTGGSTYSVSLPKKWAKSLGIKPGDYVRLTHQPDGSLLLTVKEEHREAQPTEVAVDASLIESPDETLREFIAYYLAGYSTIRINLGKRQAEYRAYIKDAIRRKLIGVEVVDETASHMTACCLVRHVEFPVKDALTRMHIIASSMQSDAVTSLRDGDASLADDVIMRDDEVDRIYFFVTRQLKMAMDDRTIVEEIGLANPRFCLGYRVIAKSIERTADHAVRIAKTVKGLLKEKIPDDVKASIIRISNLSTSILQEAMKSLYQLNAKVASQTIDQVKNVLKLEEEAIEAILKGQLSIAAAVGLRLILESIRRIAEYGSDIAEITINLSKLPAD